MKCYLSIIVIMFRNQGFKLSGAPPAFQVQGLEFDSGTPKKVIMFKTQKISSSIF